jgi:hypothetical protein
MKKLIFLGFLSIMIGCGNLNSIIGPCGITLNQNSSGIYSDTLVLNTSTDKYFSPGVTLSLGKYMAVTSTPDVNGCAFQISLSANGTPVVVRLE